MNLSANSIDSHDAQIRDSQFFPKGKLTGGILKFVIAADNKKSVSGKFQPLL